MALGIATDMERTLERSHQEALRNKIASRNEGLAPLTAEGTETIPQAFAQQVRRQGHRPAIVTPDTRVTYDELDAASRRIAASLPQQLGDRPAPVAILVEAADRFVASALGVLRSGAFYVPLDPSFPEERNAFILRESGARCILTDRAAETVAERLASTDRRVLHLEDLRPRERSAPSEGPDSLACIVFTSGSTGRPKGVVHTHATLLQAARRVTDSLGVGSRDGISLLASCSVMGSVGTVFGALLNGATLHAFPFGQSSISDLAHWLDSAGITIYRSVPSIFRSLMQSVASDRVFSSVRVVQLGGDSVYRSDWELFARHFTTDCILVNTYGCSELGNITALYFDSASDVPGGVLPVGYPLGDVDAGVIRADGSIRWATRNEAASDDASSFGEIVLRSRYLTPGYWNDGADTDAAFRPAGPATENGMRLYRTGDLGVVRPDCGLVHVGRDDGQAKLSGFRVEIAEVEACLRDCPGVKDAAVVVHAAGGGEQTLLAFVTTESPAVRHAGDIRSYVRVRLPAHMVPSMVVPIDRIPRTPNGKVDRFELLRLHDEAWQARERRAARSPTEESLLATWRELLGGAAEIGTDDDFFALGGSSLVCMRLISAIAEKFGIQVRARALVDHPTIRELAQFIDLVVAGNERSADSSEAPYEEGTL